MYLAPLNLTLHQLRARPYNPKQQRRTELNRYMPIYEYECRKCKAHTEAFQKLSDKPLTKCKKCGGRLDKVISAPAIQFKGSGWYVTDYASKATKSEKAESESASDKKSDTKTKESSPAKKTTEKAPPKTSSD